MAGRYQSQPFGSAGPCPASAAGDGRRNEKGRDAGHRGLSGVTQEMRQRILLNNDIDCICEKIVCAACSAVLCNWYWLSASA